MRRLFYAGCLVILCSTASFAEHRDYPEADFTGTFAVATVDGANLYGFTFAPAYNFNRHFAAEGDLTCTTRSTFGTCTNLAGALSPEEPPGFKTSCGSGACTNMVSYMGGIRYSVRPYIRKFQPFAHGLVGGSRFSSSGARSSGWAGKIGGGLDIVANKRTAVRVFQMDYYPTSFSAGGRDKVVFSFGVRFN